VAAVADDGDARRISASWSAFGFTVNEVDAVSDRLVDELGGHGNPDRIAALIRKHLDAAADLVVLIPAAAASG
jgi:hypothetical protein